MAAAVLLTSGVGTFAVATEHTIGFVRYARVDRPDGTFREILIDEATLAALRNGSGISGGATILMKSYTRQGGVRSIFGRRHEGGRWLFGSFQPGEVISGFRAAPQCATCHRSAERTDGTFTHAMLERFVATGEIQQTFCNRSGRTPCEPEVYQMGR